MCAMKEFQSARLGAVGINGEFDLTKRVCLNMIVKNESAIIERCLAAAAPHIDCYVICDTGSSDDTIERIRKFFDAYGIPGVIPQTTFQNFEQARNFALDAARDCEFEFDYILFCDADMELVVERAGYRDELIDTPYMVNQRSSGLVYRNLRLLPRDFAARYRGVTHEYCDAGITLPLFDGIWFRDHAAGANRPNKSVRDIELLKMGLKAEPDNVRYVFYLANSYYDLGLFADAMEWYRKRAEMGGWNEEVFYSSYRIGLCLQAVGDEAGMITKLLETYENFPHRVETLHTLAVHYQRKAKYRLTYMLAQAGCNIPMPSAGLFVEHQVYEWRITDVLAVAMYWTGLYDEGAALNRQLVDIVPEEQRGRILANLEFCENHG
jgi:glycosyltransferase involved in cell wall biosynthesis